MKVLVVRAGALGDILLLRRTIASLNTAGAHVTLMAPKRPGSALGSEVEGVIDWDGPATHALLGGEVSVGPYDVVLCYSRSPEVAAALQAVAPRVIVQDPAPAGMHASEWLAQPLAALGIAVGLLLPMQVRPPDLEPLRSYLDRLPAHFLALHPGSGSARKNWASERFRALAEQQAQGRPWLLSLGPADEREAAALADVPGAVVTRDEPPARLGALLAQAGLYVGNDSGVTHLAAAHGVPTVALFGPTDPALWAPVGPAVQVVRGPAETMDSLSRAEVEWAVAAFTSAAR